MAVVLREGEVAGDHEGACRRLGRRQHQGVSGVVVAVVCLVAEESGIGIVDARLDGSAAVLHEELGDILTIMLYAPSARLSQRRRNWASGYLVEGEPKVTVRCVTVRVFSLRFRLPPLQ